MKGMIGKETAVLCNPFTSFTPGMQKVSVQIKNKIQAKQSVSVVTCKKVYKK